MRMKKFPIVEDCEYLLTVRLPDGKLRYIVGTWDGYRFFSVLDSNDEDYLEQCVVLEYLAL